MEADVEPRFKWWDGEGFAADFVWSLNDRRRHLDGNQRKLAAARYAIELEREGEERRIANLKRGEETPIASFEAFGKSAEHAAEKFNESRATVERAVKVVKEGADELVRAVERGEVSVSAAADVATLPKQQQSEMSVGISREIRPRARGAKKPRRVPQLMHLFIRLTPPNFPKSGLRYHLIPKMARSCRRYHLILSGPCRQLATRRLLLAPAA